jgi:nucleoside-diphosphate-sugar epimerase
VTGAAGYVGALTTRRLIESGGTVTALDGLLYGQDAVADELESMGARFVRGDIRDPDARRDALEGADALVHLAAIVGDPACARDPELADEVNVQATRALLDDAEAAGVERVVFASTCSNYGRLPDPDVKVDETAELRPVSLYARQKVAIERMLLEEGAWPGLHPTCLRFATLFGAAPRMRFDLTVNEFTRDLWARRPLEVFGERFWRPYVHVDEAARAVTEVLGADLADVDRSVFNVGRTDENFRKLDLVELITDQIGEREVSWVHRDEDPRDYQVSFEKVKAKLGFVPQTTVRDGIAEIVRCLEEKRFGDPFAAAYSNV